MTDGDGETQTGLGRFGSEPTEDRPEAEARAVAGERDGSHMVVDPESQRYPDAESRIELAVTQIDYTVVRSGREERPVIHVFGRRDADGRTPEHVRVHGFEPYFYAPTDSLDGPPEEEYDRLVDSRLTDENGEPFESIRGKKLTKIIGQTPRDVGNIRDEFDHYEADILFPNRFLIDKDIKSGIRIPERRDENGDLHLHDDEDELDAIDVQADPRVHYFDIEVDDRSGFPEEGEEPIICLTTFDSYDGFDRFERRMLETDSINDRGELWFDVRPHSGHGTVEVRAPDAQADPDAVLAFVEYTHALVRDLAARYDDGETGRRHRRELLDENKWRATRHGHDAALIDRSSEDTLDLGEIVDRECERLGIAGIRGIYDADSGATRQREIRESEGADALRESLLL